jgi:hypothetical protein
MPARVIHCREAAGVPADQYVYCGRPSKWGNIHPVGRRCPHCCVVHKRGEAIEAFRRDFESSAYAAVRRAAIEELAGKVLGCWCHPRPCHVDIIADYVNAHTQ